MRARAPALAELQRGAPRAELPRAKVRGGQRPAAPGCSRPLTTDFASCAKYGAPQKRGGHKGAARGLRRPGRTARAVRTRGNRAGGACGRYLLAYGLLVLLAGVRSLLQRAGIGVGGGKRREQGKRAGRARACRTRSALMGGQVSAPSTSLSPPPLACPCDNAHAVYLRRVTAAEQAGSRRH